MPLEKTIIKKMMEIDSIVKSIDKPKQRKNPCNISLLELRTLIFINNNESVKPMDIAKKFNVTPATVTVQVDRLIKKGCLHKYSNKKDGRSVCLELTKKAKENLEKITEEKLKSFDSIFKNLSVKDQENLLTIMEKMSDNSREKEIS